MTQAWFVPLLCAAAYCQDQPMAFDAASVKVSPPIDRTKPLEINGCKGGPGTSDPGLFACSRITLQSLVIRAFGIASYQYPSIPSGDHTTYDINAKVPAGASSQQFLQMIQSLLAERFKLAYHFEKKESPVYELVIAKGGSKLKESSPVSQGQTQTPDTGSPKRDEYGFRPLPPDFTGQVIEPSGQIVRWTARGATAAEMARMLASRLQRPVTDSTGLHGKYDFTLYCSSDSVGLPPSSPGVAKGVGETDETLPPIFAMLQNTLGLKLEQRQGYFDLFVVDHVEKTPTEN